MAFRKKNSMPWRRPGWTPQPDRDFAQGSRPSDVMNGRNPAQLGGLGQMSGGSASMFRPRQGQIRKPSTGGMQRREVTQPGVKIQFSGDPNQIAQTFQSLVNSTGQVQTQALPPREFGLPEEVPPRTITDPAPWVHGTTPSPTTPQTAPTSTTSVPNFEDLQGYIDAIGGLDFIPEEAYSPYADWQPQLPHMVQAKNALDQAFLSSVGSAGVNQEVAKAFTQAALARAVQDEIEDQRINRESMNERGIFNSGITGKNAGNIKKEYLRSAEDTFADLIAQLTEQSSGLQSGYGSYLDKLLGLAGEEAGILAETPGAGGSTTPSREKGKTFTPSRKKNPSATTAHGYFGYTLKEWHKLSERKRDELRRKFREAGK